MSEEPADDFDPADLVARIRSGDAAAEAELVARFSPGLLLLLRRVTRDPTLSDDLHQETFEIALRRIRAGELREPEKLAPFLRQTAKNLALAAFRKGDRWRELDAEDGGAAPADPEGGPLGRVLRGEAASLVRRVLADLGSSRDREVLWRYYIAEEDREPICRDLGLHRTQFNLILFRARERFRKVVLASGDRRLAALLPAASRAPLFLVLAAAGILALALVWTGSQVSRLSREAAAGRSRAERAETLAAAAERRAREEREAARLARAEAARKEAAEKPAAPRTAEATPGRPAPAAALVVTLVPLRSAPGEAPMQSFELPAGQTWIALALDLDLAEGEGPYRVSIEREGKLLWRGESLRATGGNLAVAIPASAILAGDHRLVLESTPQDAPSRRVARFAFRVLAPQLPASP